MKQITSSKELTAVIKSQPNQLAKELIEAIKAGAAVGILEYLIQKGSAQEYIERAGKSTKRYIPHNCLAAAYDYGTPEQFECLLKAGFIGDENGYRGELLKSIANDCFNWSWMGKAESRKKAQECMRIMLALGKFDIQHYCEHNYEPYNNVQSVKDAIALGANPVGPGMINEALKFVNCAASAGADYQDRADVFKYLLSAGGTPTPDERRGCYASGYTDDFEQARIFLEHFGLVELLAPFGVVSWERSENCRAFLNRFYPNEADAIAKYSRRKPVVQREPSDTVTILAA
jgi:hypothetical protein